MISVIIPTYNMKKTIRECIESISNQTYDKIEIIVVNDGSSDCTSKIVEQLITHDSRIKLINQPNMGRTAARCNGVKAAKGEWINFVDADDTLPKNALKTLIEAAYENTDIILGNGTSLPNEKRTTIPMNEFRHLAIRAEGTIGTPWGNLYRRESLTSYMFDINRTIMMGEDYIFWLRLVFSTEKPVMIVYENTYSKGKDYTTTHFQWTAEYAQTINELRLNAIPKALHHEYAHDIINDCIANLMSVALCQKRSLWIESKFYKSLIAEMNKYDMAFTSKQKLFLGLPSLLMRELYSWAASMKRRLNAKRK